jgi:hypothetical protein
MWIRVVAQVTAGCVAIVAVACAAPITVVPSSTPAPTGRATSPFGPTPTPSVATNLPTLPPGVADLSGTIYDEGGSTIAGVRVQLDPWDLVVFTDTAGFFEIPNIPVPGRCHWSTLSITKDGFGILRFVDEPISQGFIRSPHLILRTQPSEAYVGPPVAEAYLGESYCVR